MYECYVEFLFDKQVIDFFNHKKPNDFISGDVIVVYIEGPFSVGQGKRTFWAYQNLILNDQKNIPVHAKHCVLTILSFVPIEKKLFGSRNAPITFKTLECDDVLFHQDIRYLVI